jgi:hypothetical protein
MCFPAIDGERSIVACHDVIAYSPKARIMSTNVFAQKRRWRVPFRISYAIGVIAPLALLAWAFIDAHLWNTARNAVEYFPMVFHSGPPRREAISLLRTREGARLLELASLISIPVLVAMVFAVRLFVGTRSDRSLRSWMMLFLLVGLWLGVLLGVWRYPESQVRYRLRRDLWRYQIIADAITSAGEIPASAKTEIGEIRSETVDTNRYPSYFLPDARKSVYEEIARIWTLEDGALLFTIYPARVALEYHPHGTRPRQRYSTPKEGLEGITVPCFEELGDGWFLVKRQQR